MNLQSLINKVRSYTRDFNGSIYRESDIIDFIYEAVDRMKKIPELDKLTYPIDKTLEIIMIPSQYHHLLAIYSSSRCFFQDEQEDRAGIFMNEFENKLEEMVGRIADGSLIILDEDGKTVVPSYVEDGVKDVYFFNNVTDTENDAFIASITY